MENIGIKVNSELIYNTIGQNIKIARLNKGITGQDLANACCLSYGYIKNLESIKVHATISIETLYLIASQLDVSIKDLLDGLDSL
ncbi:MAG: helix-turn-helix transcriptional regulator [Bacilli bacterium]